MTKTTDRRYQIQRHNDAYYGSGLSPAEWRAAGFRRWEHVAMFVSRVAAEARLQRLREVSRMTEGPDYRLIDRCR
jgi:hypothetical protein